MSDGFGSGGYGDTSDGNDGYGSGGNGGGGGSEGGFIDNAKNFGKGIAGVVAGGLDNVPGVNMVSGFVADRIDDNQFQGARGGARVNTGRVTNVGFGFLGLATSPNAQVALSNADNLNRSINAVPANNRVRTPTRNLNNTSGGGALDGLFSGLTNFGQTAVQLAQGYGAVRQAVRNAQNAGDDNPPPAVNPAAAGDEFVGNQAGRLTDTLLGLLPPSARDRVYASAEQDYLNSLYNRVGAALRGGGQTVVNTGANNAGLILAAAAAGIGGYLLLRRR